MIPDESEAAFPAQSGIYQTDIDSWMAGSAGTGVLSGCAVTAQGSPDMTVAVASGSVRIADAAVAVSSGNVTITAADGTNPRFDIVVVSNTGTKSVVAGTAAAVPVMPDIPANSVLLAQIYVPASDTAINANQIVDKRVIVVDAVSKDDLNMDGTPTVNTFNYTGTEQVLDIPMDVTEITVELRGASGGNGRTQIATSAGTGGAGDVVTGSIDVVPGERLAVYVPSAGTTPTSGTTGGAGGYNGGGTGGSGDGGGSAGGGGGGAADIRRGGSALANRIVIAGGGGGGGGTGFTAPGGEPGGTGGAADAPTGGTGGSGGEGGGGVGGSQSAGGSGGGTGGDGSLGTGGNGGGPGASQAGGGGGGGAGYYGGEGGRGASGWQHSGAGGGGGSSLVPAGTSVTGANTGNGQVVITYISADRVSMLEQQVDALQDEYRVEEVEVDALRSAHAGDGVLDGCAVTAQGSPDMTVAVATGTVQIAGSSVPVAAGNVTITAAHASMPRIDLVVVDHRGVKSAVAGTADPAPLMPAIPASSVALARVDIPAADTTIGSTQITDLRVFVGINGFPLVNISEESLKDFRRVRGDSLQWWRSKLGRRIVGRKGVQVLPDVLNIWTIGDSVMEGYGARSDYDIPFRVMHQSLQRTFRSGGFGYIPATRGALPWPYSTSPDGLNIFTYSGTVDHTWGDVSGNGFGRLSTLVTNAGAGQLSISCECDSIWIHHTRYATGTLRCIVDAGTAQEQTFTWTGQIGSTSQVESGGIYEITGLPLGVHTFDLRCTVSSNAVFEGVTPFITDRLAGIHTFMGSHSGYGTPHFAGATNVQRSWADTGIQPKDRASFTDGVGNGTTTFTSATASFTSLDVGEFLWTQLEATQKIPPGTRIVSVTNGTTVVLDKVVPTNTGIVFHLNRSNVTANVSTTTSVMTLTSGTFTGADTGKVVRHADLATGTRILEVLTATTALLSKAPTSTITGGTIRINNRVTHNTKPDLIIIALGLNDVVFGTTRTAFKANLLSIVDVAVTGAQCEHTPSVVLMSLFAPGLKNSPVVTVNTTNASNVISIDAPDGHFFQTADVGKTITTAGNTPIPASTTITAMSGSPDANGNYLAATISNNAVATSSAAVATIVSRVWTESLWADTCHTWMQEACEENGWAFFDLYNILGYVGDPDSVNWNDRLLTVDGIHPTDWAAHTIVDELNQLLIGTPENAAIDQGRFDAKGEVLGGAAADQAGKLQAGMEGLFLTSRPLAYPIGLAWEGIPRRLMQVGSVQGGNTANTIGIAAGPTLTATATNADDANDTWINHATSTTTNNPSGIISAAFNIVRPGWLPETSFLIETGSTLTSIRYMLGLFSANPDGASLPTTIHGTYFRYDTVSDATAFWRICSAAGGSPTVKTTNVAVAASTIYLMSMMYIGARGGNPSEVRFYINGAYVGSHTATLPAANQQLGYGLRVQTLTTAARNLKWSRFGLTVI